MDFSRRKALWTVGASVAATAVLAFVLAKHWNEVGESVQKISLKAFLALSALQVLSYLLRTQAWGLCVREAGAHTPEAPLQASSAATFLVNTVVPIYIGNWVRVVMLKRLAGADGPTIGQMVTADGVSLLIEGVITAVMITLCASTLGLAWWWPVLLIGGCVLAGLGVWHSRQRLSHKPWVKSLEVFSSKGKIAYLTALLTGVLIIQPLRFYVVLTAVGLNIEVLQALMAFILTSIVGALPVGPGPASVGATASVLGHEGLAKAAAGGVVLATSAVLAAGAYTVISFAWLGWQRHSQKA